MAPLQRAGNPQIQRSSAALFYFFLTREIEYLKKETQRCAQVGAEAEALTEESGELQEQVDEATGKIINNTISDNGICVVELS